MKFAKISYTEKSCCFPDEPISDTFVVEYTEDFKSKVEALEHFEDIISDYECDRELNEEDTALAEEYYTGSIYETITEYICDKFNVISFEEEEERYW